MVGAARLVRQIFHLWRLDLKVRGFGGLDGLLGVLTPLLLYALLEKSAPVEETPRLLVGMVVLSTLVMMRKLGLDLVADGALGRRALLEAVGITRGRYLAAQLVTGVSYTVIPAVVLATGVVLGVVSLPASGRWLGVLILVATSAAALGLLLGSIVRSTPAAHLLLNLSAVVSLTVAPVAYPPERVPEWLLPLVELFPAALGAEALLAAASRDVVEAMPVALLVAWTLLSLAGAGAGLRRQAV